MINFDAVLREISAVHDAVGDDSIKREIVGPRLTAEELSVVPLLKKYSDSFEYSPLAKLAHFIEMRKSYLLDSEPSHAMVKLLALSSQLMVADVTTLFRYFRRAEKDIAASIDNGEPEERVIDRHLINCATIMNNSANEQYRSVYGQTIRNFGSSRDIQRDVGLPLDQVDDPPYVGFSLDEYSKDDSQEPDNDSDPPS